MPDPLTPRQVFQRLSDGISDGRWDDLADLYAEDAHVEIVFEPVSLHGRETLRERFKSASGLPLTLRTRNVVVHETADPEVIIAEFDYEASGGDRTETLSNVQVLRVRNGLIVQTRDYHDHAGLAKVMGA